MGRRPEIAKPVARFGLRGVAKSRGDLTLHNRLRFVECLDVFLAEAELGQDLVVLAAHGAAGAPLNARVAHELRAKALATQSRMQTGP